jgi:hypothetical protein
LTAEDAELPRYFVSYLGIIPFDSNEDEIIQRPIAEQAGEAIVIKLEVFGEKLQALWLQQGL